MCKFLYRYKFSSPSSKCQKRMIARSECKSMCSFDISSKVAVPVCISPATMRAPDPPQHLVR